MSLVKIPASCSAAAFSVLLPPEPLTLGLCLATVRLWEGNNEVEPLPVTMLDWRAPDREKSLSDSACCWHKYLWLCVWVYLSPRKFYPPPCLQKSQHHLDRSLKHHTKAAIFLKLIILTKGFFCITSKYFYRFLSRYTFMKALNGITEWTKVP